MSTNDTVSSLLGLLLMGTGLHNDDWGDQFNANLTKLESAVAGVGTIANLTGGTTTLAADQARPSILVFRGALTSNQTIIVPTTSKRWLFNNQTSGGYPLTIQTAAGYGLTVPQGYSIEAYCDGANINGLTTPPSTPVGVVEEYYGIELPDARYVWANGQAISRAVYAAAFNAVTRVTTASFPAGSTVISVAEDLTTKGLLGAKVEGYGIPNGTVVTALSSNSVAISSYTAGASSGSFVRFLPYGSGDGATTFNAPDRREVVAIGASRMGGAASPGRVSGAIPNGANLGNVVGEDRHTLTINEMPSHAHGVNDNGHTHGLNDPTHTHSYLRSQNGNVGGGGGPQVANNGTPSDVTGAAATGMSVVASASGVSVQSTGGGAPHNNLQPTTVCNFIFRVA